MNNVTLTQIEASAKNMQANRLNHSSMHNLGCELSITDIQKLATPVINVPTVYFLLHQNEIVYVGSSTNLGGRIKQHMIGDKIFDSYASIICDIKHLEDVEYFYIRKFTPKYNKKMRPSSDFAPLDKIKKPAGIRGSVFKERILSLNPKTNEYGELSKSHVRELWINDFGYWDYAWNYPKITTTSIFYESFIKTGRLDQSLRLNHGVCYE